RAAFFEQHIRLYDIQPAMVERAVQTAIETFPWLTLSSHQRDWLARVVAAGDAEALVEFLKKSDREQELRLWE
ncbi:MAG: hypothetical protein ACK4ME_10055, partial [Fimbriimonadales bacterium]